MNSIEVDTEMERICGNILNSDYIMENILKHLELNDQLELMKISKRFEYILATFLWPKMYKNLTIYKTPYVNIVSNHQYQIKDRDGEETEMDMIQKTKVALKHEHSNTFLMLNCKNVRKLNVRSEYYFHQQEVGISFQNIHKFQNITELTYYRLILNDEQMHLLAQNCRRLKKLHLLECYNEYYKPLVPGEHLNLRNIYDIKHLEELKLQSVKSVDAIIKSYHLQKIFINLKLRKFILENFTINDNDADTVNIINRNLEVLNMGIISNRFWPCFMHYLNYFEKLKELFIEVSDCNTTLNVQIVDILASKCQHLEKLSLKSCDLYVENFSVLKNLKYLYLNSCGGLTFANFQQILGALTLKKFILINTRIYGVINHIYVSPSLEEITIDTIRFSEISDAFQKSLNNFENLHTLNWLNGDINHDWIIDKCPKLKYLHIPNPYLLRRIVFTVKSLKHLTFTSCIGLSWCFILILIRNLTLERLFIQTSEIIDNDKEIPLDAYQIRTTLKSIIIPYDIFKTAQSFWLDLFKLNDHLHYTIYGRHEELLEGEFLEDLLNVGNLKERLKKLEICGFKVDCLDMKKDFNLAIQNINKYTSYYRYKNANFTLEM
ncbi:uncharacterized protein ACRADG_002518 isoform 1-T1 [Cochliomyia hominivorax]